MPDPLARSSVDPLPYEVDELVRKMYLHILQDGCVHCRAVLNNKDNTAGKRPAAKSQPDSTPTYSNTTQNREDIL